MRSLNAHLAFLVNLVIFAGSAVLSAAATGCGRASSTDPAIVTLPQPPPEPPADQGEPLEKGALPGSLHVRLIFGVVSGDTGVMAQVLARFARSIGAAHYRVIPRGASIMVEIEGASVEAFKEAVLSPARVDFYRAADEVDAFPDPNQLNLPADQGIEVGSESVPIGEGRRGERHFLKISGDRAPLEKLVEGLRPPRSGLRFLVQDLYEWDDRTQSERLVGARTVLVETAAFLGSNHIVNAEVAPEGRPNIGSIVLFFDPSGAEILRKTTAKLMNRRMAVAINGRVSMLPVVMGVIPGGKAWMQVPAEKDALEKARELAKKIKRGPLPGKLDFQVEELI